MGNWLRSSKSGLVIVTIVRIFAGAEWLIAGLSKFSGSFTAKSFVQRAIDHPVQDDFGREAYPWFTSFLKTIVQPQIGLFDFLVQFVDRPRLTFGHANYCGQLFWDGA